MTLYHVSPVENLQVIKPGKRGYVCCSVSIAQAEYWAKTVSKRSPGSPVFIYWVDIPDDEIVEDCPGHYRFEYRGAKRPAGKIHKNAHRQDIDGEICVEAEVPVTYCEKIN